MKSVLTTTSHRLYTLLGATFVVFECIFLILWANDFWFNINIVPLALPVLLLAGLLAHLWLCWQESASGVRAFSWLFKGRPPIVYRQWISFDDRAFIFGSRRLAFEAVDALSLNFWGNLQVKSFSLCGTDVKEPDVVLSLPFGVVGQTSQKELIEAIRGKKQNLALNKRLNKVLTAQPTKGEAFMRNAYAVFIALLLADISFSTFSYLEMLKEYHLAQTDAQHGEMEEARRHLKTAETMQDHPLPFSYTSGRLLTEGSVAAGAFRARAETLWALGDKDEALEVAYKAQKAKPTSVKSALLLARMLANQGKISQARGQVLNAIDLHGNELLPNLYMIAIYYQMGKTREAERFYKQTMDRLMDEVYGEEPLWPPGGNRNLHELYTSDDVRFLFARILKNG